MTATLAERFKVYADSLSDYDSPSDNTKALMKWVEKKDRMSRGRLEQVFTVSFSDGSKVMVADEIYVLKSDSKN